MTALPDNNPKTAIGRLKPPLHAIPPTALVALGLAMELGEGKYGPMNWRQDGVSSSVYYDAAMRHLLSWWDGEDKAADSGIHHLAHVMACCSILLDAEVVCTLNDDRPSGPTAALIEAVFTARLEVAAVMAEEAAWQAEQPVSDEPKFDFGSGDPADIDPLGR